MRFDCATTGTGTAPSPPRALWATVVGLVFLGGSALYGGIALMRSPRDDPLGLPLEWLDETPFRDYFVPGAVLFSVFGLGSVVALVGIARRRAWAATAAIALGVAQVGWIVAEMLLLRAIHPLHVLYGGLGTALAVLASRPSVREYFHVAPSE